MNKKLFLGKILIFLFPIFLSSFIVSGQSVTVVGKTTDAMNKDVLIGVSVVEKGTTNGSITNISGEYSITVPQGTTLVFSYIGYESQEVIAAAGVINVEMSVSSNVLEDLIVIGYGVQRKSVVTAAISSVKATDIERITASRIENVLNGQVSGVSMTSSSGQPGAGSAVRIRGVGTTGDNSPLYVIDGMVIDGGIRNLNPADIASVEVLKDAASAAVYGARGGNGVILVTTKRGTAGKAVVNYEMNLGWQNPWRTVPMLNSEQYMLMHNEYDMISNANFSFSAQEIADARAGIIPSTNWQDVAFNKNAPVTDHQISIQGGNERGVFFLSLGRFEQEGILGGNYGVSNYDRWTIRSNNEYEIFTATTRNFLNKVKVGVNVTYSRANSTGIGTNDAFGSVLGSAITLPPTMTPYLSEDEGRALLLDHPTAIVHDGRVLTPSPQEFQGLRNPLAIYLRPDRTFDNEDKFIGSFWGEINILPGLVFRSSFGYDLAFWGNNSYRFPFFQSYNSSAAADEYPENSSAAAEMNRGFTRQIENVLTYNFSISSHSITLMAGQSARDYNSRNLSGRGYDLKAYDPHLATIGNALMDRSIGGRTSGGGTDLSRIASYFGRVSYDFDERYMFQATVRHDGSYKFGGNNKWGTFPSFSAGWNVWNEPTFESFQPMWWDSFKLRGSWGINGSDRISSWGYMSLMESNLNYYFGGQMYTGISAGRLPNPGIRWEESRQTNFGADLTFLRSAVTFSVDWFKKRTIDMLRTSAEVPGYVGQSAPLVNAGIVDNKGWEFDLSYRFSPARDLNIGLKANASYIQNIIVDYGNANGENRMGGIAAIGLEDFIYQKNGFPNRYFFGYQTDGIFQNWDEVNSYVGADGTLIQPHAQPGDVRFRDLSGPDDEPDGEITADDKVMLGKAAPDWVFGFTVTADYKGFDLYLFLQGIQGCEIWDISRRTDVPRGNMPAWMMDRWNGEGTSNKYPRLVPDATDRNNNWKNASDLYIHDGSFLRVKNVQIGYTLPQNITRKASVDRLRLWVGAENLFTFTKYQGFDPEIGASQMGVSILGNYPLARTFNCGIGVTF